MGSLSFCCILHTQRPSKEPGALISDDKHTQEGLYCLGVLTRNTRFYFIFLFSSLMYLIPAPSEGRPNVTTLPVQSVIRLALKPTFYSSSTPFLHAVASW